MVDFAGDAQSTKLGNQEDEINVLIDKQLLLETEIASLEMQLKDKVAQLHKVQTQELPELMLANNRREIVTADGTIISIEEGLSISIPKDKEKSKYIMDWLKEHGHENIITSDIVVPFVKGEEETASVLGEYLTEEGYDYEQKDVVNAATLKKILKETMEEGKEVDLPKFGAYKWKKSVVSFK